MEKNKEHHEGHHRPTEEVHHEKKKGLSKSFYIKIYVVLGIALVFFGLYSIFQISSFSALFDQKLIEAKEAARPAVIELAIITTNACEDCYDINAVVDVVESTGVNITKKKEIDFSSEEAKSLIDKYGVEKLPTVILTGELNRSGALTVKFKDIGEEEQDAYIFTKLEPPFVESSTGKIRGKISLIHLKKDDCDECFDLSPFVEQLSKSGLKFEKQKEIDVNSDEGNNLVNRYNIKKVPTIIIDKEAEIYPNIIQSWDQFGSIEDDGFFVMREINPPYYSVGEETIKGLVSMTIITDKSCSDCYEPAKFHKPVLERMSVVFKEEKRLDISSEEGKALIDNYKIEKIPTIILEGDVEEYLGLVNAWKDVGTVESDGTYVFRKVEVARQTYKDLTTGEIISPQAAS